MNHFVVTSVFLKLADPKVLQIFLVLALPIALAIVIVAVMIFIKCRTEPRLPLENNRRLTMDEVSNLSVSNFCIILP